jgi:acyl-coenzyme A thioesterase PaaI-like protein
MEFSTGLTPPPFIVPPRDYDQWDPPEGYDGVTVDPRFPHVAELMRSLNTRFTASRVEGDDFDTVIDLLERANQVFARHEVDEWQQYAGRRLELPGRGQVFAPPFYATSWDNNFVRGTVTFSRFHVGGNHAAHGGAISLLFDDILGRLAAVGGRSVARTAYLNVSFRAIAPEDTELVLEGEFDREEGRKRFIKGRLLNGDTVCAECDALFVALKPGQQ